MVTLIVPFMNAWCVHFIECMSVSSMSAPHVAGVAALAGSYCPSIVFATAAVPVATATLAALAMCAAQASLVEYNAPAPVVFYAAPTPFVDNISPAPAMSYVAPRSSSNASRSLPRCTRRSRLSWTTSRQHQEGCRTCTCRGVHRAGTRSVRRTCACHGLCRASTSNVRCTCTCRGLYRASTNSVH